MLRSHGFTMSKRAIITGITGQDGSYLAELLLSKGYEVVGIVRRASAPNFWRIQHLLDRITLKPADLLDQLSLIRLVDEVRPHEFYNLAAMSFVPASWDQPMLTGEFNAQGVTRVLEAIRQVDPSIRIYQASSSEMFGKVREVPQTELTPFYPRSPYGVSKVFAHYITVNYRESYDLFAVSGMLFNHESPRRGLEFVTRKVTDGVARIKLGLADTLSLGNLDAQRDWGFAGDYVARDVADAAAGARRTTTSSRPASATRCASWSKSAFGHVGLDWRKHVRLDPKLIRPGRSRAPDRRQHEGARRSSAGRRTVDFAGLVKMMVDADLERVAAAPQLADRLSTLVTARGAGLQLELMNDAPRHSSIASARSRRASASSASATSACRSPSSSRAPGFDVTGFDVDADKVAQINAGQQLHPGRRRGRTWPTCVTRRARCARRPT